MIMLLCDDSSIIIIIIKFNSISQIQIHRYGQNHIMEHSTKKIIRVNF